jgi:hypothetical protein
MFLTSSIYTLIALRSMHYALLMATTKTTTTSKPMCDLNILNN